MVSTAVFKLPRKTLNPAPNPRAVSRDARKRAEMAELDENAPSPLASWVPGFSVKAATDFLEDIDDVMPPRPSRGPEMPPDVTLLTSGELGKLHAQFVAYVGYMETQLALVEVAAQESAAYLEHVQADVRLRKTGTVPDKNAKSISDPRYVQTEQANLVAHAKAKLLKARVKGLDRSAAALSREMTRRLETNAK